MCKSDLAFAQNISTVQLFSCRGPVHRKLSRPSHLARMAYTGAVIHESNDRRGSPEMIREVFIFVQRECKVLAQRITFIPVISKKSPSTMKDDAAHFGSSCSQSTVNAARQSDEQSSSVNSRVDILRSASS
mmetsp:Transcript_26489/g.42569  ORF Transcript_26489/g.42569 Transcript_26489/m.42569 type:complete len:131 (+) Transcript_26489:64-456(+)